MDERLQRVARAVRDAGADWAVLTSADAVCYATGHVVPIEVGASPFAGGPTTAFVAADGTVALVAANVEAAAASKVEAAELYEGYAYRAPAPVLDNYLAAVGRVAARLGLGGVLAIEPASFPAQLRDRLSAERHVDIDPALRRARATKTAAEVAALTRSAQAAAIGQSAALRAARPGRSELEAFADIRAAMESFAGERVPVTGDFLSGRERTARFTGWPIGRLMAAGDPVISDLAPRVAGYWGDSCASFTLGPPSAAYERMFRTAKGALNLALELMRPGLSIAELDAALRAHVGRDGFAYPHHSGHSIGTSVHEWPRLVPYETAPLEPDMVLMVEPAAYDPAVGGVRTEWMIHITATGCEPLSPFPHVMSTEGAESA